MASQGINTHGAKAQLINNGCTSHMTKHLVIFSSIDTSIRPRIKLENGDVVQAKKKGTIAINTRKGIKFINNVLYILELDQNLRSIAQILRNGYEVSFKNNCRFIVIFMDQMQQELK